MINYLLETMWEHKKRGKKKEKKKSWSSVVMCITQVKFNLTLGTH
jgi:hypothetical protein